MQVGHHPGDAPVNFLRERLPFIPRAQARFNVPDMDTAVETQQRGRHHSGGIPLDQHPIRLDLRQHRVEVR